MIALMLLGASLLGSLSSADAAPQPNITSPGEGASVSTSLPAIAGSSDDHEDAVSVALYEGSAAEGTPVEMLQTLLPPLDGSWLVLPLLPLQDGRYTALAEQSNAESGAGASLPVTFTIDTTPPIVSIVSPGSPINEASPALTGSAGVAEGDEPTVTVAIHEGASLLGTVVAEAPVAVEGGAWAYRPAALKDGTYTATVRQEDAAGNLGQAESVTFTVDTTPPQVFIASPGALVKVDEPTLKGTAGDAPGDLPTVLVVVHRGESTLGSVAAQQLVAASGGAWTYTTPALADGTYTAQVFQQDEAGNDAHGVPVTFTIDTVAPVVSVTAPSYGQVLHESQPTFSGMAGAAAGDVQSITVKIYANKPGHAEELIQTLSGLKPAGSAWTTGTSGPRLHDGPYTVVAEQLDAAGNRGLSEAVPFTIETQAPAVTLDAPGIERGEQFVTGPSPTFSGTRGTGPEDGSTVKVAIYAGAAVSGLPLQTVVASVKGSSWSTAPVAGLESGLYTAQAEQSGVSEAGFSAAVSFLVDADGPQVAVTQPVQGATAPAGSVVVGGTAGSDPGDSSAVTLRLYAGSAVTQAPEQEVSASVAGGAWSHTLSALGPGVYTVQVQQNDDVDNSSLSTPVTFTLNKAPAVTLDAPGIERGEQFVTGPSPTFSGTRGTGPEDGSTVKVAIYAGDAASGSPLQTVEALVKGSTWTTAPVAGLESGPYTAQAEQNGGEPGFSAPVSFLVDAVAPLVAVTQPVQGAAALTGSVVVGGTAGSDPGDSSAVTLRLYAGSTTTGAPEQELSVPTTSGAWSHTLSVLAPGVYAVQVQQSDDVGNSALSTPVTFTLSQPPPVPSVPVASFQWFPLTPRVGETVSLVSTATDATSAIAGFSWSLPETGLQIPGAAVAQTAFTSPGSHVVRLTVTSADGVSSTVDEAIPVAASTTPLMQPFPIVRIAGSETRLGARISLLTVQAPVGAKVAISCVGKGCPARLVSALASRSKGASGTALITFHRFERSLRAGVRLEIRVSRSGQIGKYTRFVIRKGKLPARSDSCLSPAGTSPISCPAT